MSQQQSTATAMAVRDDSDLATLDDSPEWKRLWARANLMCRTTLVPKALQGKPADTMAVLLACQDMGLPVSVTNLNQFHVIEGSPEPSAQLTLGLAHAAGYETRWGRNDDEVAELDIRRPGSDAWERFSFTADNARTAHLLDEWVEDWRSTQDGKRYAVKYVLGSSPEVPEWAQKLINRGEIKHKDNWFNWRADMLRARVSKRAVKAVAPEVRLGIVDRIEVRPTPAAAQVVLHEPEDDGIEDAIYADGGEPFEDVQPEQQPEVQVEMVVHEKAKWELVEAAMAEGLVELQARTVAAQVWRSYRFNELGGAIPRQSLDIVLEEVRQEAKKASAAAAQPSGEAGTNPAAAVEETTLFGGES